jgi:hypothetical protein
MKGEAVFNNVKTALNAEAGAGPKNSAMFDLTQP